MSDLGEAAQQALEAWGRYLLGECPQWKLMERFEALRAALAEPEPFNPDWDRIEALQESLREHMAEIHRLRAALAEPDYWQEEARRYAGNADYWRNRYEALAEPEGGGNLPPPLQAEPVQEPVAVHQFRKQYCANWYDGYPDHTDGGGPYEERTLYTAPPQRKPLAEWQITDLMADIDPEDVCSWSFRQGVYAAEKHHGIRP